MTYNASKTVTRPVLVNGMRACWVLVILWCELGTFSWSLRDCAWPDALLSTRSAAVQPEHVLVIADPQILDHRSYPGRNFLLTRLSQFIVDWNIRKSWRVTTKLRPDAVVFLGDMMDGGRFDMPASEYEAYFARFKSIFKLPGTVPVYYLPGNHDIDLGESEYFSKYARDRFVTHFGPLNQQVSRGNHTLVLLDTPSLVNEDRNRAELGMSYDQWTATPGGTAQFVQYLRPDHHKNGIVMFTHIPLHRPDGSSCGPLRESGTIRRGSGFGYQNTLSESATRFLLDHVQPMLILSGDDHDYCEYTHTLVPSESRSSERAHVREVTVKSFSMAMGVRRPGFQLLSLAAPKRNNAYSSASKGETVADRPCLLPDQLGIYLSVYVPLLVLSLLVLLLFRLFRPDDHHRHHSSSTHRRSNSISQHRNSDDVRLADEDESEAYLLPTVRGPNGSAPTFAAHPPRSHQRDLSFTFTLGGRHRRLKVPLVCLGMRRDMRGERGMVRAFAQDVVDVAWPPLLLFMLLAVWMFR